MLGFVSTSSGSCSTWPSAAIQAFIFALLTVLYFAMAGAGHDEEHDGHAHEPDTDATAGQPDHAASAEATPVPTH